MESCLLGMVSMARCEREKKHQRWPLGVLQAENSSKHERDNASIEVISQELY